MEDVQQKLDEQGIPSQNRDRAGRTKFTSVMDLMKKPSAPAKYQPRSELQLMVDLNVAIFLATSNLPFYLVERPSFKRFVASLNPKALVKSHSTYSRNVIVLVEKNLREVLNKVLTADLPTLDMVSFTTDLWQSRSTDDYISLTLHYIDSDWNMKHFNVECRPYSDAHSGVLIARTIDLMIRDIPGLDKNCTITMTTDGASNMKKCCDEAEHVDQQLICLAHLINLALKDACAIPIIASMIKMCKMLASAVHHSTKKTNLIREKCKEMEGE